MWQNRLSGALSGSFARISHVSAVDLPKLNPPWIVRPLRARALALKSIPLKR